MKCGVNERGKMNPEGCSIIKFGSLEVVLVVCKEVGRPFAGRVLQGSVYIRGRNFVFFVTSPFIYPFGRVGSKRDKKEKWIN